MCVAYRQTLNNFSGGRYDHSADFLPLWAIRMYSLSSQWWVAPSQTHSQQQRWLNVLVINHKVSHTHAHTCVTLLNQLLTQNKSALEVRLHAEFSVTAGVAPVVIWAVLAAHITRPQGVCRDPRPPCCLSIRMDMEGRGTVRGGKMIWDHK